VLQDVIEASRLFIDCLTHRLAAVVTSGVSHRFGDRRRIGGASKAPFAGLPQTYALTQNLWKTPEVTTAAMAVCGAATDSRPDTKPVGDAGGHDGSDGGVWGCRRLTP
jgi:hypothetical protein